MCLLALAFNCSTDYPFAFAGNRDEMHGRPSAPAHWWNENSNVLGGRDLEAGGSWLGVSRTGCFAVITNRPDVPIPGNEPRSRGNLVSEFLITEPDTEQFSAQLTQQATEYAGFGLVFGSIEKLHYISQDTVPGKLQNTALQNGLFGISNSAAENPWPKVSWLNEQLRLALQSPAVTADDLLKLLGRREAVGSTEDNEIAGLPFILHPHFGTRASTVIMVDASGHCQFVERSFDSHGRVSGEIRLGFDIELAR
ncbi:MAG: NRDE family protein [Gammaproteobacteria bacterium]